MPITIGSNINSLKAQRQLERTAQGLSGIYERLASGQRINRASDDAAGLAISESLRTKSRVYSQGVRNVNDAISLLGVADGALEQLSQIVTRQNELAVQAASGTLSGKQRLSLQREANALVKEYNRIVQSTQFNGQFIIDGTEDALRIQLGYGTDESLQINIGQSLGIGAGSGTNFTATATSISAGGSYAAGDINNDGNLDVLRYGSIYIGNGAGGFTNTGNVNGLTGAGSGRPQTSLVDLNNDGQLDLVVGGSSTTAKIDVALGRGDGTFATVRSYSTGLIETGAGSALPQSFDFRDINNDSYLDVIVAAISPGGGGGGGYAIMLGVGDGSFGAPSVSNVGTNSEAGIFKDFDNDGILDLVVDSRGSALSFRRGLGGGSFAAAISIPNTGTITNGLVAADFNSDGNMDLFDYDYALGGKVFLGNGNGTFLLQHNIPDTGGAGENWKAYGEDMNGDGFTDLVLTHNSSGNFGVALGRGDGTFATPVTFGGNTTDVVVADFNNDGVPDVLSVGNANLYLGVPDANGRRNPFQYDFDILTIDSARKAIITTTSYLTRISSERGNIGALQSRLAAGVSAIGAKQREIETANSRILDTDVAADAGELTRQKILQEAASAILAQANIQPEIAVKLLSSS